MKNPHRPIIIWLLTGCFLIFAMVVIGGITRLTGSGLSITEWKVVTGTLPPLSEEAWQKEFEAYKQIPQFKLINAHFELSDFKKIYFWEYFHRLIGRLIGLVFFVPFLWFWLKKKFPPGFMKKALILFALGGFQGFLGWFMVSSGLSENVYVSHYRLAIHLISAFAVFGVTFWFALGLGNQAEEKNDTKEGKGKLRRTVQWFFALVILQIIYGAFVAGLKAGYGYPTWPKMGNEWFPSDIVALEPTWINFFEGHAGVQFIHRYIAYAVALFAIWIWWRSRQLVLPPQVINTVKSLLAIVLLQFALGVLTLLTGVDITIAILHQVGAFFLFTAVLMLLFRLRPAS